MIRSKIGGWRIWWWPGLSILAVILLIAGLVGHIELAVYAVSFWHYVVYALAFLLRRVSVATFKADAMLLKALALAAFAWAYLDSGLGFASMALIILGFGLNAWAAQALGSNRTYYGFEIGGMEAKWFRGPPFSLIAHPMLVGNMIAFAAPLLEPEFRAHWWPLALIHAALNFATIMMETRAKQMSLRSIIPWLMAVWLGVNVAFWLGLQLPVLLALSVAALTLLLAGLLLRRYTAGDA